MGFKDNTIVWNFMIIETKTPNYHILYNMSCLTCWLRTHDGVTYLTFILIWQFACWILTMSLPGYEIVSHKRMGIQGEYQYGIAGNSISTASRDDILFIGSLIFSSSYSEFILMCELIVHKQISQHVIPPLCHIYIYIYVYIYIHIYIYILLASFITVIR